MSTASLGSLVPGQSFRFTSTGLSQLFQLKPELIGTVTVDQIWRRQARDELLITLTSGSLSVSLNLPVSFEVTTNLVN